MLNILLCWLALLFDELNKLVVDGWNREFVPVLALLLLFVLKRFDVELVFGKRLGAVLVCGVVKLKGFVEGVAWAGFVVVDGKREDVAGLLKRLLVVLNKPLLGAVVVLGAVVLVLLFVNEKGVVAAG